MSFELGALSPTERRSWTVKVDGVEITPASLSIESRFARILYGRRPEEGWECRDGILMHIGGGVNLIPYIQDEKGPLLLGLILESRPNLGPDPVLCAIGGDVDTGESEEEAMVRETLEESGLNARQLWLAPGVGSICTRTFHVRDADNPGMSAFGLRVMRDNLLPVPDHRGYFSLKPECLTLERESQLVFLPWKKAVHSAPGSMTRAAIAQVLTILL